MNVLVDSWQFIDPNAGQKLVGLALTPQGSLLCLKEGGLYEMDDVTSGSIGVNFVGSCRPVSHHAMVTTPYSVIFTTFGSLFSEYISGAIRNIGGKINLNGRNDALRFDLYTMIYYNNKVRLSMPNMDISADYNSQEYILNLNLAREDSSNPYVITRNRRYFGCYWVEDMEWEGIGRDITLYIGDSRPEGNISGWVNDFRDEDYVSGLNGETQPCFFITKFFTDNVPFYVKRFKKAFANIKVDQDITITIGYRFLPYGSWTEQSHLLSAAEMDMTYDDGTTGGFTEGYGFSEEVLGTIFADIENAEKPRGIQFKISWSEINDVTLLGMAYQYKEKKKFK
jgi:hypothetical protein